MPPGARRGRLKGEQLLEIDAAIGRAGGERAAVFYSLIGCAKLNGLDPEAYLRYVFARIADHPITRIEELLPWSVAQNLSPANQVAA